MAELKSLSPIGATSELEPPPSFGFPAKDGLTPPKLNPTRSSFVRRYVAKRRQCHIIKNLVVICIAFLLNFTAFQNIQNLQSSLNPSQGLGTVGLAIIYGSLMVSALLLPSCLIRRFSCKWTMTFAILPYLLYIAANFYPTWYTVVPTSLLLGLGAAPLWTAKCTYITESGTQLAKITGETREAVVGRFFGIFFMAFQSTQIWGNLISGFILHDVPENGSLVAPPDVIQKCGPMYCTDDDRVNNTNLDRPDVIKIYTLLGTFGCLSLLAFLTLALCLDRLSQLTDVPSPHYTMYSNNNSSDNLAHGGDSKRSGLGGAVDCSLLVATVLHWRDKRQLLLVPLTIFSGLQQAFLAGDYTRSYVSCTLGVWMVGMVMICYGVTNALCSCVLGHLLKVTGRTPLIVLGALLHCALLVSLFLWQPDPELLVVFFVVAGLWGVADAVWQTQINSLYGNLFLDTKEAAFSNYRLWESFGFIIGFTYSHVLCTYIKIYIILGALIVGMAGYFILERGERRGKWKRRSKN